MRADRRACSWLVGAGVVVLVATLAAVVLLRGRSSPSGSSTPSTSSPAASPSKPATRSASPHRRASSAAPTGAPTVASVAPAAPQRMQVGDAPGVGFAEAVRPAGGTVSPGSEDLFARLATRGQPGSPGRDTVVVLGVAGSGGAGPFGTTALRPGAAVVVETSRGRLGYRIERSRRIGAQRLLADPALQGRVPGRLVLVAVHQDATRCAHRAGHARRRAVSTSARPF